MAEVADLTPRCDQKQRQRARRLVGSTFSVSIPTRARASTTSARSGVKLHACEHMPDMQLDSTDWRYRPVLHARARLSGWSTSVRWPTRVAELCVQRVGHCLRGIGALKRRRRTRRRGSRQRQWSGMIRCGGAGGETRALDSLRCLGRRRLGGVDFPVRSGDLVWSRTMGGAWERREGGERRPGHECKAVVSVTLQRSIDQGIGRPAGWTIRTPGTPRSERASLRSLRCQLRASNWPRSWVEEWLTSLAASAVCDQLMLGKSYLVRQWANDKSVVCGGRRPAISEAEMKYPSVSIFSQRPTYAGHSSTAFSSSLLIHP